MIKKENTKYIKSIPFLFLLILISSIEGHNKIELLNNTLLLWTIDAIICFKLFQYIVYSKSLFFSKTYISLVILLSWIIITTVRGVFTASNYWEYKFLIAYSMLMLSIIAVFLGSDIFLIQATFRKYYKWGLVFFVVMLPFLSSDGVGYLLAPFVFISLFIPILRKQQIYLILIALFIVLTLGIESRSNILRFVVAIIISLLYYFPQVLKTSIFKTTLKVLFFVPFFLFLLGTLTTFNVFNMNDYLNGGEQNESDNTDEFTSYVSGEQLTADTRTFLYVENIASAIKNDYWFFGHTAARGYDTIAFADFTKETVGKFERSSSEVLILNVFTWYGLLGVLLIAYLYWSAIHLALTKSNNRVASILAIFVLFRWWYIWVEELPWLSVNYLYMWFAVGLCFSKQFREMSDKEVKYWVNGLFDDSYSKLHQNYITYKKIYLNSLGQKSSKIDI